MKKDRKIKIKEIILIVVFSVAVTFSICIFNQFDVLFRNQVEFGIQPQEIILGFIIFSLSVFFLNLITFLLLLYFSKKTFKIVLSLVLGYVLASYVQVLLLNGHYNGAFIDFAGAYKPISLWVKTYNLIIWLIVFFLPLSIIGIEKLKKKEILMKMTLLSSIIVLTMQVVGFITAIPEVDFQKYDNSFYFSVDQQLNLSKKENENIVVFILDRTAVGYTNEVFKKFPKAKENFEGFTYYTNNKSEYRQTFPSVISMLTGENFVRNETRESFSNRAWSNATLFAELHARNYTVNMLLDASSTYYNLSDVLGKVDNINYHYMDRIVYQQHAVRSMTKMSLQRTLPYVLKQAAGFNYPDDLNLIVGSDISGDFPSIIGRDSDLKFENKIKGKGLSTKNNGNTFSLIHLDGSHANEWLEATNHIYNVLGKYFEQMKKLGIYDNSTIILTADHGAGGYANDEYVRAATLFIKEKGQGTGAMKIDEITPLSNGFFLSTIFELIGAEEKKTTTSYFDVIHRNIVPERYYYHTSWDIGNYCQFYRKEKISNNYS